MITRLKISRSATGMVTNHYTSLGQQYTPNILLRNALMLSIKNSDKYNNEKMNFNGSEFQMSTLLGSDSDIYKLLLDEYYNRKLGDEDFKNVLVFHFEQGLKSEMFKSLFNF
jgi:DNA sulfur modification protein DndE